MGADYINTLCTSLVDEVNCSTELERRKLESCLTGLSSVSVALGGAQELGHQQLRNTAIKPRVLSWLESFTTLSHVLTEVGNNSLLFKEKWSDDLIHLIRLCCFQEEFSSYEANEPFIRGFIGNIDNFLTEFKGQLTSNNYETLVSILATEVNNLMEKVVLKTEFNRVSKCCTSHSLSCPVSPSPKTANLDGRNFDFQILRLRTP